MQKNQIIETGKKLYDKNLTVGTSGNISIRTNNGILITATGTILGNLKENDIILIDENGMELSNGKASSEKKLHIEIYKQRPDIKAIIHTHPVYLTTFAVCHQGLSDPIMSETILYFKDIPIARYAMPSSEELADNTAKYFKDNDTVIMANHGAITAADTLEHAFLKMEMAEYYANVTFNARILGNPQFLTDKEISDLLGLKNQKN